MSDEPMDSHCEEAGLRRSANACQPQVEVVALPETRKEKEEEEEEKKAEVVVVVPGALADSEKPGQGDPLTAPDVGPPVASPKPGKVPVWCLSGAVMRPQDLP